MTSTQTFYSRLHDDPYAVHVEAIKNGRLERLKAFTMRMVRMYDISLAIRPVRPKDVGKWRMIAKVLAGQFVDNTDIENEHSLSGREMKGLRDMCCHIRQAHMMNTSRGKVMRAGSIVRPDKLDKHEHKGFVKVLSKYNGAMRVVANEGGVDFIGMMEWLESHPDELRSWLESKEKRVNSNDA